MHNICYRLTICFMMILTFCHPLFKISATLPFSSPPPCEMSITQGKLKNGLKFTLLPSISFFKGIWIRVSGASPIDSPSLTKSLLLQHSLFYGTQQYTREEIAQRLDSYELDIDADSYIELDEEELSLNFSFSDDYLEKRIEIVEFIHQLIFSPSLENEGIELARHHLIDNFQEENKETLSLESITADEIRTLYTQAYSPEKVHFILVGIPHSSEVAQMIADIAQSPIDSIEEIIFQENMSSQEDSSSSSFMEKVEWTADHQTLVVDGKIWMKEPNWINKSSYGKALGTALTILGCGSMMLLFPLITPAAAIAGGVSAISGIYLLATNYLKDPHYIEMLRKTDLQKGCTYTYQQGRIGLTLTPYERRTLFLQEMVQNPQKLPYLPILTLADIYQLNHPAIAQIFNEDEFNALTGLKKDFVQQRNQYKMLKNALEKELATLIAPYAQIRDASLAHTKKVYDNKYSEYLNAKTTLDNHRRNKIWEVEQAYLNHKISFDQKYQMIDEINAKYHKQMSKLDAELMSAKSDLEQRQREIQTLYQTQVELCKQSIQYYDRLKNIQSAKSFLIQHFNQELISLLSRFPPSFSTLPDHLDLRGL